MIKVKFTDDDAPSTKIKNKESKTKETKTREIPRETAMPSRSKQGRQLQESTEQMIEESDSQEQFKAKKFTMHRLASRRLIVQLCTLIFIVAALIFAPFLNQNYNQPRFWNFNPALALAIRTKGCDVTIVSSNISRVTVKTMYLIPINARITNDDINPDNNDNYLLHNDNFVPSSNDDISDLLTVSYLSAQNDRGCSLDFTMGRWGCVDVCNITIEIDRNSPPPKIWIQQFEDDTTKNMFVKANDVSFLKEIHRKLS